MSSNQLYNQYQLVKAAKLPFAQSTVVWDMDKLTVRVRNRVMRWLDEGIKTCYGGQASSIYDILEDKFNLSRVTIGTDRVSYKNVDAATLAELKKLQTASLVMHRMQHSYMPWWGTRELSADSGWFILEGDLPTDELRAAAKALFAKHQERIDAAKEFISTGQKIEFTY